MDIVFIAWRLQLTLCGKLSTDVGPRCCGVQLFNSPPRPNATVSCLPVCWHEPWMVWSSSNYCMLIIHFVSFGTRYSSRHPAAALFGVSLVPFWEIRTKSLFFFSLNISTAACPSTLYIAWHGLEQLPDAFPHVSTQSSSQPPRPGARQPW